MYINSFKGKNGIEARMVADSVYEYGNEDVRISTLELRFHRFILPEFNTHRMFSRNASSSRAIPTEKILEQVRNEPAVPVEFGKNKSGMQSDGEHVSEITVGGEDIDSVFDTPESFWGYTAGMVANLSKAMSDAGYHKQITNRITECFQYTKVIVTATEWDNFFNLRLHPAAQPEINELARCMREAFVHSVPTRLKVGEWHLPYITEDDYKWNSKHGISNDQVDNVSKTFQEELLKMSVARCARVSYMNHDNTSPDNKKDLGLHDMLYTMCHMSPFEHQATPMPDCPFIWGHVSDWMMVTDGLTHMDKEFNFWSANFKYWIQYRQQLSDKIGGQDE